MMLVELYGGPYDGMQFEHNGLQYVMPIAPSLTLINNTTTNPANPEPLKHHVYKYRSQRRYRGSTMNDIFLLEYEGVQ